MYLGSFFFFLFCGVWDLGRTQGAHGQLRIFYGNRVSQSHLDCVKRTALLGRLMRSNDERMTTEQRVIRTKEAFEHDITSHFSRWQKLVSRKGEADMKKLRDKGLNREANVTRVMGGPMVVRDMGHRRSLGLLSRVMLCEYMVWADG
jgi:hypothetical protein